MKNIKTYNNFFNKLNESRYKVHGLSSVKRYIPKILNAFNCIFEIFYNEDTDDFGIELTNIDTNILDILISRCELLGYFPSVFDINGESKRNNEIENIEQFIKYIKTYKLPKNNKVYIQFECWLDIIVNIPQNLYHVCRTIDVDEIKRYGLYPKAKNKISYHPDRIYFVDDILTAKHIIKEFKQINKENSYSIIKINPGNTLILRKDPNFNEGYYTTQNIPPTWIEKILNF